MNEVDKRLISDNVDSNNFKQCQ